MASLVRSVSVARLGAARREMRCARRATAVVPRSRVTRARVRSPRGEICRVRPDADAREVGVARGDASERRGGRRRPRDCD